MPTCQFKTIHNHPQQSIYKLLVTLASTQFCTYKEKRKKTDNTRFITFLPNLGSDGSKVVGGRRTNPPPPKSVPKRKLSYVKAVSYMPDHVVFEVLQAHSGGPFAHILASNDFFYCNIFKSHACTCTYPQLSLTPQRRVLLFRGDWVSENGDVVWPRWDLI